MGHPDRVGPSDDLRTLSDELLLDAMRGGGGVGRALRAMGCWTVLLLSVAAGFGAESLVRSFGAAPWLQTLVSILAFALALPLSAAVFLPLILRLNPGGRAREAELRRRIGQLPMRLDLAEIRRDLRSIDPGQRGWVVLIRGKIPASGTVFRLRADLRTDSAVPVGEWSLHCGPDYGRATSTPKDLRAWERSLGPVPTESCADVVRVIGELRSARRKPGPPRRMLYDLVVLPVGGEKGLRVVPGAVDSLDPSCQGGDRVLRDLLRAASWSPLRS